MFETLFCRKFLLAGAFNNLNQENDSADCNEQKSRHDDADEVRTVHQLGPADQISVVE